MIEAAFFASLVSRACPPANLPPSLVSARLAAVLLAAITRPADEEESPATPAGFLTKNLKLCCIRHRLHGEDFDRERSTRDNAHTGTARVRFECEGLGSFERYSARSSTPPPTDPPPQNQDHEVTYPRLSGSDFHGF
jgi:hypothetical protein